MSELFKSMGRTFLVVTAGALFSMAVILSVFSGWNLSEPLISVAELWRILFIAIFSALTCLLFYSHRELGARQMLIRKVVQFIVVLAGILFFAIRWRWIVPSEDMLQSVTFVVMVLLVYAMVMFLEFKRDKQTADALNLKLNEYREKER